MSNRPDILKVDIAGYISEEYSRSEVSEASFEISLTRGLDAATVMFREATERIISQVSQEKGHREHIKELESQANAVPIAATIVVEPDEDLEDDELPLHAGDFDDDDAPGSIMGGFDDPDEEDGEEMLRAMEQAADEAAAGVPFGTTDGPERME